VDCRLEGLSKGASAAAAGQRDSVHFDESEMVQAAMIERMQATADEVDFSRKEAHDMYMDAYRNAETATEQIAAVTAMVKMHGLEKPKIIEHKHDHTHVGALEYMPLKELMKLADMDDLTLEGEYKDITDVPILGAPEATDDNTEADKEPLPTVSEDY
jgi:hypothetical protein